MKGKRPSLPCNRERIEYDDLLRQLMDLVFVYRGMIRVTILKNIALVTYALLTLFHGAWGGNSWLSQAALARCLPLTIGPLAERDIPAPVDSCSAAQIGGQRTSR